METSSFLTSLIVSFLIFAFLVLLYSLVLSRNPRNAVIYYPAKIIAHNQANIRNATMRLQSDVNSSHIDNRNIMFRQRLVVPPWRDTSRSCFSWIYEACVTTEDQILATAGLDATIYMIFLSSALRICLYTSIVSVVVLIPISATGGDFERQKSAIFSFTNFDKLGMGNVQDGSNRLWVFAFGAYWLTFSTLYVLWSAYKHVVGLRLLVKSLDIAKPEQYAVLFRDIPIVKSMSLNETVDSYLARLHPDTYETSIIITSSIAKESKTYRELKQCERKLAHAEAAYAAAGGRTRPTHKTGGGVLAPLVGRRVDSMNYFNSQIRDLSSKLRNPNFQASSVSSSSSSDRAMAMAIAAIAVFKSRAAAAMASQVMHSEYGDAWQSGAAPEPRDMVWENLALPSTQRLLRRLGVAAMVGITILFYMIPIAFISSIISLENLQKRLPFLRPLVEEEPVVSALLQAFLPQIVLAAFLMLLPAALKKLSWAEGIPARSHVERAAAGKYFYFNVFNVFLGVSLAGTLFSSLNGILDRPKSVVSLLGQSLPKQATFFISFVALRFFVGYGLTLTRLVPLIIYNLKKRFFCKTDEEVQEAWYPPPFRYATCVPADMLILTITICYSVIAPAILPFAVIYFGLGLLLMKHQALNVVVPRYESGGRMWPHIHSRILAALFLSQLTMLGYFGVKKFIYGPLLLPPIFITLAFAYLCRQVFYMSFTKSPLVAACRQVNEIVTTQSVVEAYTPPCYAH